MVEHEQQREAAAAKDARGGAHDANWAEACFCRRSHARVITPVSLALAATVRSAAAVAMSRLPSHRASASEDGNGHTCTMPKGADIVVEASAEGTGDWDCNGIASTVTHTLSCGTKRGPNDKRASLTVTEALGTPDAAVLGSTEAAAASAVVNR